MGNEQSNKPNEPNGLWKNTTESYTFDQFNSLLIARLKSKNGVIKESSVLVTHNMMVENNDGEFNIVTKGHYKIGTNDIHSNVLPAGNWSLTAKNVQFSNGILSAQLLKPDRTYNHSTMVVLMGDVVENDCGKFKIVDNSANYYLQQMSTQQTPIQQHPLQYPLGSWIHSAENIKLTKSNDTYILTATLICADGSKKQNTLQYKSEFDTYENDNGTFKFSGNYKNKFI